MSGRKSKNTARLEFDEELIAGIHRHRQHAHSVFPIFSTALVVMLLVGVAVWASQAVQFSYWSSWLQSTGHLDKTCLALIEALRTNHLKSPLPVCADSESGSTLIEQENARIMKAKNPAESGKNTPEKPREFSLEFLSGLRRELEAQGLPLDQIQPIAFGGVRAKVLDPEIMDKPADSINGELFFSIGEKVFALEFTARRCGANFIITDFWNCKSLDMPPEKVNDRVAENVEAFQNEPECDPPVRIKSPKRIFLSLVS